MLNKNIDLFFVLEVEGAAYSYSTVLFYIIILFPITINKRCLVFLKLRLIYCKNVYLLKVDTSHHFQINHIKELVTDATIIYSFEIIAYNRQ